MNRGEFIDIKKLESHVKPFRDIEKHLDKNEHWFQKPGKRMSEYEQSMNKFNGNFLKKMNEIEKFMKTFEKKMDG